MSPSKTGRRDAAVSRCFVHALGRLALSAAICGQGCSVVVAQTRPGPTVADVVGFTRIVAPAADDADSFRPLVSPDGRRAFVVTRKADIEAGRNRYEILLLDLRPDRLAAGRPDAPVSVARIEPVLDNDSAQPAVQDPRWVGERSIVFRARLPGATMQAFRLDAPTGRLTQLTHAATDVVAFAVSDDLRTVVYTAQHPNPPLAPGQRSVVVGNRSFWSVKFGQHDMNSQLRQYRTWAVRAGGPPRPLGPVFDEGSTRRPVVNVSPDGRWALLPRYEPARQAARSAQYPLVAEATRDVGPALVMDPLSYFVRLARYVPKRLVAYRLADGRLRAARVFLRRLVQLSAPQRVRGWPLRRRVVWRRRHRPLGVDHRWPKRSPPQQALCSFLYGVRATPGPRANLAGARGGVSRVLQLWPRYGRGSSCMRPSAPACAVHNVRRTAALPRLRGRSSQRRTC